MSSKRWSRILIGTLLLLSLLLPQGTSLLAQGLSTESISASLAGLEGARAVYGADVDKDGLTDYVVAAQTANRIAFLRNTGSGFSGHAITTTFDGAASVYATDLDGDTEIDILGAAFNAGEIAWWQNDGSESFAAKQVIASGFDGATSVFATDIDGDSDVDVVGAAYNADEVAWWENDGSESFSKHVLASDFNGAISVYATDIDGDNDVDIVGAASEADDIFWWENTGSNNFTAHIVAADFDGAHSVHTADVDGDNDVDIVGAAFNADTIAWWENDGSESFSRHIVSSSFDGAASVYAMDVNRDGHVDLLGAGRNADAVVCWINNAGSGQFSSFTLEPPLDGAISVHGVPIPSGEWQAHVFAAGYDGHDISAWRVMVNITDAAAPAAITDLTASTGRTTGSVSLSWTAPGDDGNTGAATFYAIRYSDAPITDANWAAAADVSGEPLPAAAGTVQGMTVGGLTPGETYYFAIRAVDEALNVSPLSNVASAAAAPTTGAGGYVDLTISLYRNPGSAERGLYENTMRYFADAIYEATNGAHRVRNVTFYVNGYHADDADVLWEAGGLGSDCWPMAHISGYDHSGLRVWFCDVNRDGENYISNDVGQQNGGYTLAHEWGHYYYGLYDEYRGRDATAPYPGRPLASDVSVPNSIMHQQRYAILGDGYGGDFSWLNFSTAINNSANSNAQRRCYAASAWETLIRPAYSDPRDGQRASLPRRVAYSVLASFAPPSGQTPSIELPAARSIARSELQFSWENLAPTGSAMLAPQAVQGDFTASAGSLTGNTVRSSETIVVYGSAAKGAALIANAVVTAGAVDPLGRQITLTLKDDGASPDAQAGDGLYTGILMPPDGYYLVGVYTVTAEFDNSGGNATFTYESYSIAADKDGNEPELAGSPVGEPFSVSATADITVLAEMFLPIVL